MVVSLLYMVMTVVGPLPERLAPPTVRHTVSYCQH